MAILIVEFANHYARNGTCQIRSIQLAAQQNFRPGVDDNSSHCSGHFLKKALVLVTGAGAEAEKQHRQLY